MRVGVLVLLAVGGVAIAAAWGARALLVYAFFVAIVVGLTFAAGIGGDWVRDVSSRRFDDRRR